MSWRRISQRNICIIKATELINWVTDKGESLSECAVKTFVWELSTADKATLVDICVAEKNLIRHTEISRGGIKLCKCSAP